MNDELTKKIFGIKSKGKYGNIVLSTEKPNPNYFFKRFMEEYKNDKINYVYFGKKK